MTTQRLGTHRDVAMLLVLQKDVVSKFARRHPKQLLNPLLFRGLA